MKNNSIKFSKLKNELFPPSKEFNRKAFLKNEKIYEALYKESIDDPEKFWGDRAEDFLWDKKWDNVLNQDNKPFVKWFDKAKLNITTNILEKNLAHNATKNALIWEGENFEIKKYTYKDLYEEVSKCTNTLIALGIKKGDRVILYMPMIPEFLFSILACARLGAIHSVVFAGFSANSLRERISDCEAKLVITADGAFRRGKVLALKNVVDDALENNKTVEKCLIFKNTKSTHKMREGRDIYWEDISHKQPKESIATSMNSDDILFILYTSGSTGKPKGIQHAIAGYMIGVATSFKYVFDYQESDIFWCTADIGWITGHSYVAYGPLLNGATIFMYEGTPNFPDFGRFWELIEKHKITTFYTAPTAIRSFMKWGNEWVEKYDLSSLRLLGTVGEPINPEAWLWFHNTIGKRKCPIVDTWWQTETGSIMISPLPAITKTKPGCATKPFFGIKPLIVDEKGNKLEKNKGGFLVLSQPWPSMATGIYGDKDRFFKTYWEKFKDKGFYLAGDGAVQDDLGYFTILGRIDDVINVSGHRLSTIELENCLVESPLVVEAAVIGYEHPVKGETIAAFVIGASDNYKEEKANELINYVAKKIGSFAKPEILRFTPALPKTRSGKIMRRLLKKIAEEKEIKEDISTMEDISIIENLQNKNPKI